MRTPQLPRRAFLGASVATAALAIKSQPVLATESEQNLSEEFIYEIQRTETEWRLRLSDEEYRILREGGTEEPKSHPMWEQYEDGLFFCKGCDLQVYESTHRIPLDKGWVFFLHSTPNSMLMDIDRMGSMRGELIVELLAQVEVHCRRCGSHLGHIVYVPEFEGRPVHCINGNSLNFTPVAA